MNVLATGSYVPVQVLSTDELEASLHLAPGTVQGLIGVKERRIAPAEHAVSDLAFEACHRALDQGGLPASDLGLIILATSTPDHPVPATAPRLAHLLGAQCPAFDLANTCAGWIYAMSVAHHWLQGGGAGPVLVVGANVLTRRLDWKDWPSAALFGDGAGAVVLAEESVGGKARIVATALDADGSGADKIRVEAGGSRTPTTADAVAKGQHLLRIEKRPGMMQESVSMLERTARRVLDEARWTAADVAWFLPHQANARLIREAASTLHIDAGRTLGHLERYGNMSAACLPVLLDEESRAGRFQSGDRLLLATVAAGMSSGALALEWT